MKNLARNVRRILVIFTIFFTFQAIDILTRATRISPTTNMLILLGKTCMKAKQYENAIASFKRAIHNLVSANLLFLFFLFS